ncbi:MAG: DUF4493 domain-containing protein [Mucinivorans sp.]
MFKRFPIFLLFGLLVVSCNRSKESNQEGTISVSLNTDSLAVVVSKATAAAPAVADFAMRIENTRGEVLRQWATIAQMPATVNMMPGSYRFVASHGTDTELPSWDKIYWQGDKKFKVDAGQKVDVPIVVKLGVVKVKVNFDAAFTKYYSAYSADIRTTTPATPAAAYLNYTPLDVDKEGAFLPGTLRMRLHLTSKLDGVNYSFSPAAPVGPAAAAELHTINLKINETSGTPVLSVELDGTMTEITVDMTKLPASALPKAAPRLRAVGFDKTQGEIIHPEGEAAPVRLSAAISAPGGVKSLRIVPQGAALIARLSAALGGGTSVEIVGIDQAKSKILQEAGFVWTASLSDPSQAINVLSNAEVRFSDLFLCNIARPEDGAPGSDYSFAVEVIDQFDQSSTTAETFLVPLRITPPVFSLVTPTEGNVWAKTALFSVTYNAKGKEPQIELQRAGGATPWSVATQESTNDGKGNALIKVSGLLPSTSYRFRAALGDHKSTEYEFTTESTPALENGTMESWTASQLGTSQHNIPYYSPYTGSNKYWVTNNDRTTAYRSYAGIFGLTYGYNCFPAVSYTLTSKSGKYAAEIRTTSASDISPLNFTNVTQSHSQVAGLLYIGDFSYAKPNDNKTEGRAFASRPTSMSFYYTYTNYNNDSFDARISLWSGQTKIGEGIYKSPAAQSVAAYQQCTVKIAYANSLLRADKMTIVFRSTTKDQPEVRKVTMAIDYEADMDYNKNWSIFVGSVLRVDDISLNY